MDELTSSNKMSQISQMNTDFKKASSQFPIVAALSRHWASRDLSPVEFDGIKKQTGRISVRFFPLYFIVDQGLN